MDGADLVYRVKHLGLWQGHGEGPGENFEASLLKAAERAQLWEGAWGRHLGAVVWRTYIVSLWGYVGRFFRASPQVASRMRELRRKVLNCLTWHGAELGL